MSITQFSHIGKAQDREQVVQQSAVQLPEYPTLKAVEDSYRSQADVASGKSAAELGFDMLSAAGAKREVGEKPNLIDSEIQRVSFEIREESKKEKANWTKIDYLIRQLAVLLLRKAGKSDMEMTQAEVERMREEIQNVKGTYNNFWSLLTGIGCGTISIIGGMVGAGANIAGLGQLANGAAKVSQSISQVSQFSQSAGAISQGIQGAVGQPLQSYYESKRQAHQFDLQLTTNRRDVAQSSAGQNRNMQGSALSNLDRMNENLHNAAMRILSASA
ncbi:hypothetical protein [Estrella lausannensis]|uniref:Conserved putative membrane protein n=1 Tax=Estrella lausannensis TaxID=483423 RepID=A0A0H5DPX1_9BACT|nr:hypothetical protein [Estrella lausannensis]CRX38646.1 Conserved putative membrane protein [Estrella lausannensis]